MSGHGVAPNFEAPPIYHRERRIIYVSGSLLYRLLAIHFNLPFR